MAYFSKRKMIVFEIQIRDKRIPTPASLRGPYKLALDWFGH